MWPRNSQTIYKLKRKGKSSESKINIEHFKMVEQIGFSILIVCGKREHFGTQSTSLVVTLRVNG